MPVYKNCTADIYYQADPPDLKDPGYEVRLEEEELVISYQGTDGWVNYRGKDLGGGHYELSAPEVDGRSLLHRLPDGGILEGNWSEAGYHGMWRIYLA